MTHRASGHCLAVGLSFVIVAWLTSTCAAAEPAEKSAPIHLAVRWQEPAGEQFAEKTADRQWAPRETAILICDTWNKHWCASATTRCDALAKKMAPLVEEARARGVHIIHAPSDTIDFYRDHPARKRALAAAKAEPPSPIGSWCPLDAAREGALPIDDSDGGCDCQPQCKNYRAWSRQHPAIRIDDADVISDNGQEVYNYLARARHQEHRLHGRAHQHVRAGPFVRHSPDDEAGFQRGAGARSDRHHVQPPHAALRRARRRHRPGRAARRASLVSDDRQHGPGPRAALMATASRRHGRARHGSAFLAGRLLIVGWLTLVAVNNQPAFAEPAAESADEPDASERPYLPGVIVRYRGAEGVGVHSA